jgi:type II restriction/modification system DNA methylase subunit YeeA
VDFIVGNPPFLGGKRLRRELGDEYVDRMFEVWRGRVPAEADLVAYWFEKAREQIAEGKTKRTGLLATQGIRGGANREVLKRIKESGEIFFAESDRNWILDGAMVHVSLIAFDTGAEGERELDGKAVEEIYSNLTATVDVTGARQLPANAGRAFMGDSKGGPFEVDEEEAMSLLLQPNPHGRPNSDVIIPWFGGRDLNQRPRSMWIIDFGDATAQGEAAKYEVPFRILEERVRGIRKESRSTIDAWWLHERARPEMRSALSDLHRFPATTRHGKHRFFCWLEKPTLPDSALIAFATGSECFFGFLESRFHEVWTRAQGTQVRDRETGFRYTPTSCFETFPFPEPTESQTEAVADASRELDQLRERWLNPPEWVREVILEFPGAFDGPWTRYVHNPDAHGIGTVRYPRLVARDEDAAAKLAKRTLTNLYNQRPTWLQHAHQHLDEAVAAGYGWPVDLTDEEILERLLALNLERASGGKTST